MITVDFDKKMQRQIELSLMNLGADMRKNKRQISKEVLKPSAQIISKEMKSIAPKLKQTTQIQIQLQIQILIQAGIRIQDFQKE